MLINTNKLQPILLNFPEALKFALIYGYDEGQISIIMQEVHNAVCNGLSEVEVKHLDYAAVKVDVNLLHEEAAMLSMFCAKKIIIIDNCKEGFDPQWLSSLSNRGNKFFIILRATELKKTSKLVKFFEKEPFCLAVPCYKEEAGNMMLYIKNFFNQHNIKYAPEIPQEIANLMPANQLILRNELEKLILYKHPDTYISIDDVAALFSPESELLIDELCLAVGLRKKELIKNFLIRIDDFAAEFMLIIRSLQNYFHKALTVKITAEQDKTTISQAVAGLTPPLFFKQRDGMIKVAQANSTKEIKNILRNLLQLEKQSKQSALSPSLLLGKFLLN